jgi:hypothetical protein
VLPGHVDAAPFPAMVHPWREDLTVGTISLAGRRRFSAAGILFQGDTRFWPVPLFTSITDLLDDATTAAFAAC